MSMRPSTQKPRSGDAGTPEPQACFACGRSYAKGDGRFCSVRCRDAFDNGNPQYGQARAQAPSTDWVVIAGPPGTVGSRYASDLPTRGGGCLITCKECQREFVSKGLRCCSPACERAYCERLHIEAAVKEVGGELPSRPVCQCCGARIPRWRKGRAVPKNTKFCSPKCQQKAWKQSGEGKPVSERRIAQKPPSNGPLPEPVQFPSVPAEADGDGEGLLRKVRGGGVCKTEGEETGATSPVC
jgi:hypothetical protein